VGGTVDVSFSIGADGAVKSAAVARNTTGHDGLGRCLIYSIKRWRFPRPVSGEVTFVYPFFFARQ
jgi:TonB family protein